MDDKPAVPATALEAAGAVVSPTSLQITDPNLPWEKYMQLGAFIGEMNRACAWFVGDLIVYGEQVYGETHTQIDEVLGLAPQTIANRASVARHIPPNRRRDLPFGTHAEVAYLEPKERDKWLQLAEKGGWTRAQLRQEMRAARGLQEAPQVRLSTNSKGQEVLPREDEETSDRELPVRTCPHCGKEIS